MRLAVGVLSCAIAVGCGGSPTAPSDAARGGGRLMRTRFMAFGDSLTVGDITNTAIAYPELLQTQLRLAYPRQASNITVVNAGEGGERLVAGVLRFEGAFAAYQPDAVLLMEGINDLLSLGPDISTQLLQIMAQHAMSRNARVFVGSMLPSPPGRRLSQPVAEVLALNSRIESMARQQGAVYVDLYNPLLPADAFIGPDGLHPTEVGYRRIAETFFTAIRQNLEQ